MKILHTDSREAQEDFPEQAPFPAIIIFLHIYLEQSIATVPFNVRLATADMIRALECVWEAIQNYRKHQEMGRVPGEDGIGG